MPLFSKIRTLQKKLKWANTQLFLGSSHSKHIYRQVEIFFWKITLLQCEANLYPIANETIGIISTNLKHIPSTTAQRHKFIHIYSITN
jgi:hypothetical protein